MKKDVLWSALALTLAGVLLSVVACRATDGWLGQTMAAWVQAVGSVLAILAAIVIANQQIDYSRKEAQRASSNLAIAAVSLASRTLAQVADRLTAAARPQAGKSMGLALREHRTTELVETLRQVNIGDLPPDLVVAFSTLRSRLYAVNARITQIYDSEQRDQKLEARRKQRVRSSLLTYDEALADYHELSTLLVTQGVSNPPRFEEPTALRTYVETAKSEREVAQ